MLVFVSLVLSDIMENSFCLWCLARNVSENSNRVSPLNIERELFDESSVRKSETRRPSNIMWLARNKEEISDKGTTLFIAAILLQREAVEITVPVQAAGILTLLYVLGNKSNYPARFVSQFANFFESR